MEDRRQELIANFNQVIPGDGSFESGVKGLRLFRRIEELSRSPMAYEPQILIMIQGQKVIYLDEESFQYDPYHYVVLSVPLPLECEAIASKEEPAMGISIAVEPSMISAILLEDESIRSEKTETPKGIYAASLSDSLFDAVFRLIQALGNEHDAAILGPMIIREIIYRVLSDEHGWALQALALQNRGFFQISRILQKIQTEFDSELEIKNLAYEAGMSLTTFHTNFKMITGSSPLQYIKNIRLHKAREFMSAEGMSAYSAAYRVGYESPSQFSREYKRLFGSTPAKDAIVLSQAG